MTLLFFYHINLHYNGRQSTIINLKEVIIMTKKIIDFMTTIILIIVAIFALINLVGCGTTKEKFKDHDTVVDVIYNKYYSNTKLKKEAYEFKTIWKNNELMYVTEHHTEGGMHYVAIFDNELNLVNGHGECSSNYDDLMEDVYKLIEEL